MQAIKQRKFSRRSTIIALIVIVAAGGIAFAIWQNTSAPSNDELTQSTDQTSAVKPDQIKDKSKDGDDTNAPLPQKPPYQDHSASDHTSSQSSGGEIEPEQPRVTRAEQDSNGAIRVAALFQQQSSGNCELHLTRPGQPTISRKANIVTGPSYYACGFTVPRSELPAGGTWNAVVLHHIGNASTPSDANAIQVE